MTLNNFCTIFGEFLKSEQGISNSFRHCLTRIQISHNMEFFCFPCFFYVKIDSINFNYIFYLNLIQLTQYLVNLIQLTQFLVNFQIHALLLSNTVLLIKFTFAQFHLIPSILPRFTQTSSILLINSNKHILALVHHIITFTFIFT